MKADIVKAPVPLVEIGQVPVRVQVCRNFNLGGPLNVRCPNSCQVSSARTANLES